MDPIELARQHARRLHDEAVQRGRNPWSPYEFAVGIASDLGITVETCAPDAALLDGGRAYFDPDLPLIVHETEGSPFDQAFLVAHEIGHAELGDGGEGPEPATYIDPARTSEAAPVGMDRVVDYSRRQRREVQMDLFARELLLPRPVAFDLHVAQGQTCSNIAARLGAPFEVVAQQMLDALLLPAFPVVAAVAPVEIPLNDKQRAAAAHRGAAFLLQAGPGTGKTRTLVARVESLLDEGVDPRRILLLTFSNKAAGEMSDRIAQKRPQVAAALCIGTFHSFGLDILRRFNDRCELPQDPRLMDRTEAVEMLENEFPRLGLTHYRNLYDPSQTVADILAAVSRAKDEVVGPQAYLALAQAMLAAAASEPAAIEIAEKAAEVASVYVRYEELKATTGSVDFGDLVMQPVLLLERDEAVRTQLQDDYDHVLVDEYQDVNRSSVRLLTALKPTGENLWVVGDAKQSIYRFRGASSFNMARFGREDFPGGVRDSLDINYRSTSEVVGVFSTFAATMSAADGPAALEADRGPGGASPEVITVSDGSLLTSALVDSIEQFRTAGFRYRDQAVLCRGNDRLSDTGQELERAGVPVLFLGSLFERTEIKDLVALLMLLVDRRAMGLIRSACWPEFAMTLEDSVRVFERLRGAEVQPGAWRQGAPDVTLAGQAALAALSAALDGFDATAQPWTVLATLLLDRTRLAARIASSPSVPDQAQGIAIWQFMNFVRVQPNAQGLPIQRLADRVRRLLRLRDDRDLRQLPAAAQGIDAVRLMTIHGSKGLEFPVVHMVGVNQDSIPGAIRPSKCPPPIGMVTGGQGSPDEIARAAHNEEQECLFYVAMSRARDRLAFYGATAKSNGTSRPLSRFLDRIGAVSRRPVTPLTVLPPAPDVAHIPVVFTGTPRFSSEAVGLYESCGRRFLYTHLLQVGGRRSMSAFMLMHEAIREVYRKVVAQGAASTGQCEALLAEAFVSHGLHDHGYVEDYRAMASTMLGYFLESRAGALAEAPTALRITFNNHEVEVTPDEVLVRNGVRTLRRVKTGHASSQEGKDVGVAAFVLAARAAFPNAVVELVYLADAEAKPLVLSAKELSNRQVKLGNILRDIQGGNFRAEASDMTCPNCPAFFVCGAVPPGTLVKAF